jgi:hypothetical protein
VIGDGDCVDPELFRTRCEFDDGTWTAACRRTAHWK